MLQDPLNDNVVPIVEELQRILPLGNPTYQGQGEDGENLGPQNDIETSAENGITSEMTLLSCYTLKLFIFVGIKEHNWIHQFFKDFNYSVKFSCNTFSHTLGS